MDNQIREKNQEGREIRNKIARNKGVKTFSEYNNKYKRANSYIFCLVHLVFTATLIVLQWMAMAKTISLFSANNEIYFMEPKDVREIYTRTRCDPCADDPPDDDFHDNPVHDIPDPEPDPTICGESKPECTEHKIEDSFVLDNSVYCFANSFTFTLNTSFSLRDMQGKTLLRIVRPPYYDDNRLVRKGNDHCVEGGAKSHLGNHGWGNDDWRTLGFKSLQYFFVASTSIMIFYDAMKAFNVACPRTKGKGLCCRKPYMVVVNKLQCYVTDRGYRRRYDGIDWDAVINECVNILSKAWHIFVYVFVYYPLNFVTSVLMNPGRTISTADSVEVTEVENYEFLITSIDVMNCYFMAQFFFFSAFFWVITHPKVLQCIFPCAPKCFLDFCRLLAITVMAVSFVVYAAVIAILYFAMLGRIQILHIFFGFNFNFKFPSTNIRFVASIMITIGVLRFTEAVARAYSAYKKYKKKIKIRNIIENLSGFEEKGIEKKVIENLSSVEEKHMDFFVRLVYHYSNAKMTFYAHMKILSKNKDFYYLGSQYTGDQATVFFVVLRFKRAYTREEVEDLLFPPEHESSRPRPKITFSFDEALDFKFDNAAAEQKAIMSKPHIVHVEEQVFRPFCFHRWFLKKFNTKDYQRRGTKEKQEETIKYDREENLKNIGNNIVEVEMV
jgi:hypothetical protein